MDSELGTASDKISTDGFVPYFKSTFLWPMELVSGVSNTIGFRGWRLLDTRAVKKCGTLILGVQGEAG